MPSNVVRWITNFLTGRTQAVLFDCNFHLGCQFLKVQGSCIGHLLYIIFVSHLKLLSTISVLCKYADDDYLLIPEKTDICLQEKFEHIMFSSAQNRLKLNLAIKLRRRFFIDHLPIILLILLFLQTSWCVVNTLSMDMHVNHILSVVD
jgi:hypothetical protein